MVNVTSRSRTCPMRRARPGRLLLRVERTGICGSDLHPYHGVMAIPGTRLGHEFVGTVEDIGADVQTVARATGCWCRASSVAARARACRAGDVVGAARTRHAGLRRRPRAARRPGRSGRRTCGRRVGHQDPRSASPPSRRCCSPTSCPTGYLGALRADITPGDTVVVFGLGPVGVFALQCAQLFGPARILAVDRVARPPRPRR